MSTDYLIDLKEIGRDLSKVDGSYNLSVNKLPQRLVLVLPCQRRLMDQEALADGYHAAQLFTQADFSLYFYVNPEYAEFCEWISFFLENVHEYLAIVITGFPIITPDGAPAIGIPFTIKDREILPSRLLSIIRKHKAPDSRLTLLINGCPAVETWSNEGEKSQKLSFSVTSSSFQKPIVRSFKGEKEIPEHVLLVTSCPRLDAQSIKPRTKTNIGLLISELINETQKDPVKSAADLIEVISPHMRTNGMEAVFYGSSSDVVSETPFLL